jgi:3-oxoacyl-[acyl-carrier-protein] synthase II
VQEVVVTGIGPILPNCDHRTTLWQQLRDGQSQLRFEQDPHRPDLLSPMGRIHDFNPQRYLRDIPHRQYSRCTRSQLLYLSSLVRAVDDAGLDLGHIERDRIGLFDGTSRDNFDFWSDRLGDHPDEPLTKKDLPVAMPGMTVGLAASMLGVRGPTYTFSGTCTSGAIAIGSALRDLRLGEVDVALATGHDAALLRPFYAMYRDANLLSEETDHAHRAVRPYIGHSKNVFGEGAVTLVLETRDHAVARGATIIAELAGYRFGNSGMHPTHIDTTGSRPAELITSLLDRCHVRPEEVGFVIGHGNGVEMSDRSEIAYMKQVFGDRAASIPLLSTKPNYGHVLGASGAISVAAAALMLSHEHIAPTLNIQVDQGHDSGVSHHSGLARPHRAKAGVVVAYGMGGMNAVLLLKRASLAPL